MTRISTDQPARSADQPTAIIVIGGSAGSFYPLREFVASLPADLPAAVLVAIHRGERAPSQLAQILARAGRLPAVAAGEGDPVRPGFIYVAPPGRHLMSYYGRLRLSGGPRVNRHRPAIDVLFASTARWAGSRTLAIVLSGVLDDGAVGAALVAQAGGQVLVQDPAGAHFAGMPTAALAAAPGARAAPTGELAAAALRWIQELDTRELPGLHMHVRDEAAMDMADSDNPGFLAEGETKLTRLACPECGGGLAQVELPQITYFRCHVGHQYAPQTLAAAQADAVEAKLWSAVAALEEQATVQRFLNDLGQGGEQSANREEFGQRLSRRAAVLADQVREWTAQPAGQLAEPSH